MQNIPSGYMPNNTATIPNNQGVNIYIFNPTATQNPNGANINNTYSGLPGQSYPPGYYINNNNNNNNPPNLQYKTPEPQVPLTASQPIAQQPLQDKQKPNEKQAMKSVVQLTDEYVKTLENYLRNPNPDVKLMGAKELMKRFREDESRKNDVALTNLLNLTLQSKYAPVRMIGLTTISNGWAKGDDLTRQLLSQIQQSDSTYGLDALDAAEAALKSSENTVKIPDTNPEFSKEKKTPNEVKNE